MTVDRGVPELSFNTTARDVGSDAEPESQVVSGKAQ